MPPSSLPGIHRPDAEDVARVASALSLAVVAPASAPRGADVAEPGTVLAHHIEPGTYSLTLASCISTVHVDVSSGCGGEVPGDVEVAGGRRGARFTGLLSLPAGPTTLTLVVGARGLEAGADLDDTSHPWGKGYGDGGRPGFELSHNDMRVPLAGAGGGGGGSAILLGATPVLVVGGGGGDGSSLHRADRELTELGRGGAGENAVAAPPTTSPHRAHVHPDRDVRRGTAGADPAAGGHGGDGGSFRPEDQTLHGGHGGGGGGGYAGGSGGDTGRLPAPSSPGAGGSGGGSGSSYVEGGTGALLSEGLLRHRTREDVPRSEWRWGDGRITVTCV